MRVCSLPRRRPRWVLGSVVVGGPRPVQGSGPRGFGRRSLREAGGGVPGRRAESLASVGSELCRERRSDVRSAGREPCLRRVISGAAASASPENWLKCLFMSSAQTF
ncbi:zinc finger protein 140 isoform X4 [Ailuropoda melanoleuca]|uniref:zinc finger protein 140 isoform X4 n=1 Tax=Ailuropoda melanoleuca TaxID=9646 RepID=UPI0014945259|nr:zinc finger protein 140 isoform X4 [Ailuropoda melanoleuca]